MTAIHFPQGGGWARLFKLVAPLHLFSPLEGDLAEDHRLIALEHGQSVAGRWLSRQLKASSIELLWGEFAHSPWRLLGIGVVSWASYLLLLAALTRLPLAPFPVLRQILGAFLIPFLLGCVGSLIFGKRELSTVMTAGLLSAASLYIAGVFPVAGLFVETFSRPLTGAVACALGWIGGGIFIKLLRIRDYENREQVGMKAAYQKVMHFEYSTMVAAPVERVFSFHERPDAIQLLTPWWLFPSIKRIRGKGLEEGVEVVVTTMGLSKWHARHVAFERNKLFVDEMVSGPMKSWRHEHRFQQQENGTLLTDSIDFVPIGPPWPVNFGLRMLFAFRHAVTRRCCEAAS